MRRFGSALGFTDRAVAVYKSGRLLFTNFIKIIENLVKPRSLCS